MDPARWDRIESLCAEALERPRAEWRGFLAAAAAGDETLRREAESLLDQIADDPSFLERPVFRVAELLGSRRQDAVAPETIGPYRVLRILGSGGMGRVYLADHETEDIHQTVAVKVIGQGRDTGEVLRRFRLERRILAGLRHPNIARFLDAGATREGLPYFAMEYVVGQPIDRYCADLGLSTAERLRLVDIVCGAVQHAHRNLVVHRDLKPGNILVDDAGVPKLLDFGIGKVLGDSEAFGESAETVTGARPLSPAYAAPEQILDEPVTTATDVYALGVLLYQLLTGRHPYRLPGLARHEIERAVLASNPPPLSAAAGRHIATDLDRIVRKATRREPERRYASAEALADDMRRHLAGLPVSARPDTAAYRASKFVRRNPAWTATAAIAALAFAVVTTVTHVQAGRLAVESERVMRERDTALEVRGFLMETFGATAPDRVVGDSLTVRQLLDLQTERMHDAYGDRPGLRAEMLEVLAEAYDRLGYYAEAEPLARAALDLRRARIDAEDPGLAASLNLLGWILHERGASRDAESMLREAAEMRRVAGPRHALALARSLNDLGVVLTALGRYDDAESVLDEALAIRAARLGEEDRAVGISASNLAGAYYHQGRFDDALRVQELAVRALARSVGPDHQRLVVALGDLATFRLVGGDLTGAIESYRELLERQERIQGRDHPVTASVMGSLANAIGHWAAADGDTARFAESEALMREALAVLEARLGPVHPQVGTALDRLANILHAQGKLSEALDVEERAVAILDRAYGHAHPATTAAVTRLAAIRAGVHPGSTSRF